MNTHRLIIPRTIDVYDSELGVDLPIPVEDELLVQDHPPTIEEVEIAIATALAYNHNPADIVAQQRQAVIRFGRVSIAGMWRDVAPYSSLGSGPKSEEASDTDQLSLSA